MDGRGEIPVTPTLTPTLTTREVTPTSSPQQAPVELPSQGTSLEEGHKVQTESGTGHVLQCAHSVPTDVRQHEASAEVNKVNADQASAELYADQGCAEDDTDQACVQMHADQSCTEVHIDQGCAEDDADQACAEDDADQASTDDETDQGCAEVHADQGCAEVHADQGCAEHADKGCTEVHSDQSCAEARRQLHDQAPEVAEVDKAAAQCGDTAHLSAGCAKRAALELDSEYKMNHGSRGVAAIFNNGTFSPVVKQPDRPGYQEDGAVLKQALHHLGFEVRYYQDLTVQNIVTVLELLRREGHRDSDCLCLVFLTRGLLQPGSTNDVIFGKDGPLWVENVVAKFNGDACRSLSGKPKLIFVEASRDSQEDVGDSARVSDTATDSRYSRKLIPLEADILLAQSTVTGYASSDEAGSLYVHSLARTLVDYGRTKDIHWLLTRVNNLVATHVGNSGDRKLQMPVYRTTLTRQLTFPEHTASEQHFVLSCHCPGTWL